MGYPQVAVQHDRVPVTPLWHALARVVAFALLFLFFVRLGGEVLDLVISIDPLDARERAARAISGALLGQIAVTALILLWLVGSRRGLAWVGLRTIGPARAWVGAAAIAAGWVFLVWNGVLAGTAGFDELSLWRFSLALGAGLIGGACEEIMFRGVAIQSLAEARAPRWLQVASGTFLFGLAHLGWAAISGNLAVGIGAAVFTSILGLALSLLFLWGGRSLWPCLAAHAAINLLIEPWLVFAVMSGPM
jgi:hypothetical protein